MSESKRMQQLAGLQLNEAKKKKVERFSKKDIKSTLTVIKAFAKKLSVIDDHYFVARDWEVLDKVAMSDFGMKEKQVQSIIMKIEDLVNESESALDVLEHYYKIGGTDVGEYGPQEIGYYDDGE